VLSTVIQDMTTKGMTTMIDRYRRIQREIREEQAEGDEGGFTLIELLIVIVVLGILAAVTVFGLSNVTGQSLTSACHADAKSVAVATEAYRAQNPNTFPASVQVLVTPDATGNHFLRSLPGNNNKYNIAMDPTAPGVVVVQSKATGVASPWPALAAGNYQNAEDPSGGADAGSHWTGYSAGPPVVNGADPCGNL